MWLQTSSVCGRGRHGYSHSKPARLCQLRSTMRNCKELLSGSKRRKKTCYLYANLRCSRSAGWQMNVHSQNLWGGDSEGPETRRRQGPKSRHAGTVLGNLVRATETRPRSRSTRPVLKEFTSMLTEKTDKGLYYQQNIVTMPSRVVCERSKADRPQKTFKKRLTCGRLEALKKNAAYIVASELVEHAATLQTDATPQTAGPPILSLPLRPTRRGYNKSGSGSGKRE